MEIICIELGSNLQIKRVFMAMDGECISPLLDRFVAVPSNHLTNHIKALWHNQKPAPATAAMTLAI